MTGLALVEFDHAPLDLGAPQPGAVELEVPKDDAYYAAFNEFVDVATALYGRLREICGHLGLDLPEVPQGDATELFVTPLSGDWNVIIASGDAVTQVGMACRDVGANLARNQAELAVVWRGEAALGAQLHLGLHAAAFAAAGMLLEQLHLVFDAMAEVALLVGRAAIEILDEVLRLAAWLARQIPKRIGGAGVMTIVADTLRHGTGWVEEIIGNIRGLVEAVQLYGDLVVAVADWAATVPDQLALLERLGDLFAVLPDVVRDPGAGVPALLEEIGDIAGQSGEIAAAYDAVADAAARAAAL